MGKRQTESRNQAIITAITKGGMSYQTAALHFNISTRWARILVKRYELGGLEAIQPRSKRPHTNPNQTSEETRQRVLFLRQELTRAGLDAGPESIWDRLPPPKIHPTTIYRILRQNGHITPNPKKRPKRSYTRFQAQLPNEMWQSDFTHINLADTTTTEVITWLDDHSRYALHISAHKRITVHTVIDTFTTTTHQHGYPTSTLTDNGMVSPPPMKREVPPPPATPQELKKEPTKKTCSKNSSTTYTSNKRTDYPDTPPPKAKSNASKPP